MPRTRGEAASRMLDEMGEETEPEDIDYEGPTDEASEERARMKIEIGPQDAQGVKNIVGLFKKGK